MNTDREERQFELFDDSITPRSGEARICRQLFDAERKNANFSYEQLIFISCSVILALVVTFSLGVEKGRQAIPASGTNSASALPELQNKDNRLQDRKSPAQERMPVSVASVPAREKSAKYIVQLVSYKKENFAKEELERLKMGGMSAFMKRSGEYYLVCLAYDKKESADSSARKLKRRYQDCFVKKAK